MDTDLALAVDDEVTVTVTGRVVCATSTSLVIEYPRPDGFPTRTVVDRAAPGVTIAAAAPPDAKAIAARQDAYWLMADAAPDLESRIRALLEVPYPDRLTGGRAIEVQNALLRWREHGADRWED